MPKYYLISIIISLILFSCSKNSNDTIKVIKPIPFGDTLRAKHDHFFGSSTELLNPLRIVNVDERYLIVTEQIEDNFFKVFKLPDVTYLYEWGKKGRGPNEFEAYPTEVGSFDEYFYAFNIFSQTMETYIPSDSTLNVYEEKELRYEGQTEPLNKIRRINSELYFVDQEAFASNTDTEHIAISPNNREPLFTFGEYPSSELDGLHRYSNFLKTNAVKPDNQKFVTFYITSTNQFKIYDSSGNLIKKILIDDPLTEKEALDIEEDDQFLYRTAVYTSNNFIYTIGLYNSNDKIYYKKPDPNINTYLEIWDWDGNSIYRAPFDNFIHSFTVSEKNNSIYGFSPISGNHIYEYDISSILEIIKSE